MLIEACWLHATNQLFRNFKERRGKIGASQKEKEYRRKAKKKRKTRASQVEEDDRTRRKKSRGEGFKN
jgi:hypothetical protein